jgi:hypothetical protein
VRTRRHWRSGVSRWRSSAISFARRSPAARRARLRAAEAVARARCVVARGGDRARFPRPGLPAQALEAARATLEEHGDRPNAAHAKLLRIRRLVLIGRLDEAERILEGFDAGALTLPSRTAHELVVAGIAIRRLRTKEAAAALARAWRAGDSRDSRLIAEVESAAELSKNPPRDGSRAATSDFFASPRLRRCRRAHSSWTRAVTP